MSYAEYSTRFNFQAASCPVQRKQLFWEPVLSSEQGLKATRGPENEICQADQIYFIRLLSEDAYNNGVVGYGGKVLERG